jgi:hypothetical protein
VSTGRGHEEETREERAGAGEASVTPLSTAEVGALLRSLGFAATPEDLDEITHRLNAFTSALEPLAALDLDRGSPPAAAFDLHAS